MDGQVIGTVESLACPGIGDRPLAAIHLEHAHPPVAVLTRHEPALAIEGQAIASGLLDVGVGSGESGRLHEDPHLLPLLPAMNSVVRNVAEKQHTTAVFSHPHRAFRPGKTHGQHLDPGVGRHKGIKPRVESLDATDGGSHRRVRLRCIQSQATPCQASQSECAETPEPRNRSHDNPPEFTERIIDRCRVSYPYANRRRQDDTERVREPDEARRPGPSVPSSTGSAAGHTAA
jgi:hypothetical protein